MLHGGGKFGGSGYKVSGGLHGVGVSVVNALSTRLIVEVDRDGKRHRMEFADGGKPQTKLEGHRARRPRVAPARRSTFWPDPPIFDEIEFRAQTILERLQMYAFLNARPGDPLHRRAARATRQARSITSTPAASSTSSATSTRPRRRSSSEVGYYKQAEDDQEVEVALQWNTGYYEGIHGFANGIATIEGGMHDEGFKKALTNVVNKYARAKRPAEGEGREPARRGHPRGPDRHRLGASCATRSSRVRPRRKLGNVPIRSLVERATNEKLAEWLEEHPTRGPPDRRTSPSRRPGPGWRPARPGTLTRRKSALDGAGLPGKLVDCSSRERAEEPSCSSWRATRPAARPTEARNPRTQAILPIRGKILNVERARIDKMLKNTEIQALIAAIGAGRRRGVRRRQGPLPQGDHPGRRRRGRQSTSAPCCSRSSSARCGRLVEARLRVRRPAAAVLDAGRQGEDLPEGRRGQGGLPGRAPQPQERVQPAEGSRRDGLRRAAATPPWTRRRARCCRSTWSRPPSPTRCARSSWVTTSSCASTSSRPTPKTSGSWTSERHGTGHRPVSDATSRRTGQHGRRDDDGGDGRRPADRRHRAHRDPGGDGALLPRLRHVGHRVAGPARRPRRPEAGAPPDPLRHARPGLPARPPAREVRQGRRRRHGRASTPTATPPSTTPWSAWPRTSACATP